tara:strand:- start:7359 stop:7583 length:225 start_codon:yes stop_codon:yes gene_type:complete
MKVNVPHGTQYMVIFLNKKHKMLGIRMLHKNEYLLVSGFSRRIENQNILNQETGMVGFFRPKKKGRFLHLPFRC